MLTVQIPDTVVYRNPKLGITETLDWTQFATAHGADAVNTMVFTLINHGFGQKCGDGTAKGEGATDEEKKSNVARIAANLRANLWAERGGARLDPVLVEMRGLAVQFKLMKSDAAKKATESEIAAACGAKFAALKKKAEAIVALANAPLELDEPTIEVDSQSGIAYPVAHKLGM